MACLLTHFILHHGEALLLYFIGATPPTKVTPTKTFTPIWTPSPTYTPTKVTPTKTFTPIWTPSPTYTPSSTPCHPIYPDCGGATATITLSPVWTPTKTFTPIWTPSKTYTPTPLPPTKTLTPFPSPTWGPSATPTFVASSTPVYTLTKFDPARQATVIQDTPIYPAPGHIYSVGSAQAGEIWTAIASATSNAGTWILIQVPGGTTGWVPASVVALS